MAQTFRQVDEGFDHVVKGETNEEMIKRLKEWGARAKPLVPIVRIGVGAEKPEWDLPEGTPETLKLKEDIPEGMGESTVMIEWRRIRQFFEPGSNMNNLAPWKREQQWINILEGVHHKEAKILTAVKDGKLLELYPALEKILPDIGITEYNKPKKKVTKKRSSKNAKGSK